MKLQATLVLAVLFILPCTGNGESSELTGIRYSVRDAKSRVTFRFAGTVNYSAGKSENIITLVFPGVSVGSPPGEARLNFVSGAVQGVDLRRVGRDSAIATIRLRSDDRVEYSSSEDGHALYVDVLGGEHTSGVYPGATQGPSSPPRESAQKASTFPVARKAIEDPVHEEQTAPQIQSAPGAPDRQGTRTAGLFLSVLLSLTVSAAGTIAILWFFVRRKKRVSDRRPADAPGSEPETLSLPRLSLPATQDPQESTVRSSLPEVEEDNPGLDLAERFQRSRSELDFAIQLSSMPYAHGLEKELTGTHAASMTMAQRTVVAKKLGVGRGELDLIANLSKMKEHAKEGNHD